MKTEDSGCLIGGSGRASSVSLVRERPLLDLCSQAKARRTAASREQQQQQQQQQQQYSTWQVLPYHHNHCKRLYLLVQLYLSQSPGSTAVQLFAKLY